MQYRQLGKWGARLSVVGLGTHMNIGEALGYDESLAMLRTAHEAGVDFIDTAEGYGDGVAEAMLGRCLKDFARSDWFLLTKAYATSDPGPNARGLSAKHIREACDASLQRLQTDYVDAYLCHHPDAETPLEETVRAMGDLLAAGKILYWGASNFSADMVVEANAIARGLGVPQIAVCEPRYNLIWRQPEEALFPLAKRAGFGCVTYSPLGHGLLAGVYKPGQAAPEGSRAAKEGAESVTRKLYFREDMLQKAEEFSSIAGELGAAPADFAIAWCMANSAVTSVILGAWSSAELEADLRAVDLAIPDDVMARLDALFPRPQPWRV